MDVLTAKIILVAEDEDFARRVLVTVLTSMGARPIEAADGKQALRILNERRIDIALLDVLIPHVNGLCVLQAIRAGETLQDFEMPVLLLTATHNEACVHFAASLSCNGFIVKPVTKVDLSQRLAKLVVQQLHLPYKPLHYRKIDVGPPDQAPMMPHHRPRLLELADLQVGMVFRAPVTSMGRLLAPKGTRLTGELLALLSELNKVAPIDPMSADLFDNVA